MKFWNKQVSFLNITNDLDLYMMDLDFVIVLGG